MHEKYVPELIVKILSISVDTEETLQSRDFSLSSQTFYLKIAVTYLLTRRNCLNKISCMIAVSLFLSLSPTHHVGTTLQRNTDTKTLNLDSHVHLLSFFLSLSLTHTQILVKTNQSVACFFVRHRLGFILETISMI